MKIVGLNAKEHKWNPKSTKSNPSKYHKLAKNLLAKLYPFDNILEEVTLPGTKTLTHGLLYADFFITGVKLIVEVQGEQHYKFNNFFYKNKLDYFKAIKRDKDKQEWCQLNQIRLIHFPFMESLDEWTRRIREGQEFSREDEDSSQ